jgi:hypothetical protein
MKRRNLVDGATVALGVILGGTAGRAQSRPPFAQPRPVTD